MVKASLAHDSLKRENREGLRELFGKLISKYFIRDRDRNAKSNEKEQGWN